VSKDEPSLQGLKATLPTVVGRNFGSSLPTLGASEESLGKLLVSVAFAIFTIWFSPKVTLRLNPKPRKFGVSLT
jgi:hypothetical protein